MNSKALRRLAADHGALHNQELPPNFLHAPTSPHSDNLTQLDILIAGPTHTPFAKGVWKLHLTIPPTYPQQPPTANFRTPIFHPNVDPQTGGVCVETLKRDWDSKLTLRDVLVTISCLLIQPNPDSALNAEAGALIREDYDTFARRAELMTSIHAVIPQTMQSAVREAQTRGQEMQEDEDVEEHVASVPAVPARRRRTIAKVRGIARRSEDSPSGAPARRRPQAPAPPTRPFVFQTRNDDVFGITTPPQQSQTLNTTDEEDEDMEEAEQENDAVRSPPKAATPPRAAAMTPRRPHGVAVPLGELIMEQEEDYNTSEDMEAEYPPSPRKSPSKSPPKRRQGRTYDTDANIERPESSRDAALRAPNITPPNFDDRPLAEDSLLMDVTFDNSPSPQKTRRGLFAAPAKSTGRNLFGNVRHITPERKTPKAVFKTRSPTSAERRRDEQQKREALDAKLWELCGDDIKRWNRGDFDGMPFQKKAARW